MITRTWDPQNVNFFYTHVYFCYIVCVSIWVFMYECVSLLVRFVTHTARCLIAEGSEWRQRGFLSSNLVNELMAVRSVPLMRLHMHRGSHHRSSSPRPFKGNHCFKCSSRRHLKVAACFTEGRSFEADWRGYFSSPVGAKMFLHSYCFTFLWRFGVFCSVCVNGECVCAFVCGVIGIGRSMNTT